MLELFDFYAHLELYITFYGLSNKTKIRSVGNRTGPFFQFEHATVDCPADTWLEFILESLDPNDAINMECVSDGLITTGLVMKVIGANFIIRF